MATVKHTFTPQMAEFQSSAFPQLDVVAGTNFPVASLAFDAAATERAYFPFQALNYGSGNLTATLYWYAVSATSGAVMWETALAAITAETDSQDVETKAFATAQQSSDTHLGTTAKRIHQFAMTVSNLDSLAADDYAILRVSRIGGDGGDTMTGDAKLVRVVLSYSDT